MLVLGVVAEGSTVVCTPGSALLPPDPACVSCPWPGCSIACLVARVVVFSSCRSRTQATCPERTGMRARDRAAGEHEVVGERA